MALTYDPTTGMYNTPSGQAPLNLQDQINAYSSDLSSGDTTQAGAQNAYNQLMALGGTAPSSMSYSVPNGGGLSTLPFTPTTTSNSALTSTLSGNPGKPMALTSNLANARESGGTSNWNPNAPATNPVQVRMPDGSVQTINTLQGVLDAINNKGTVLQANGTPYNMSGVDGGLLFNGQPLNVVMGYGWLPGQQSVMAGQGTQSSSPGTLGSLQAFNPGPQYSGMGSTTAPTALTVQMPGGGTQTFNTVNQAAQAILAGGTPLNAQGQPETVTNFDGGYLVNGMPLNVAMGLGWVPGQTQALAAQGMPIPNTNPPVQAGSAAWNGSSPTNYAASQQAQTSTASGSPLSALSTTGNSPSGTNTADIIKQLMGLDTSQLSQSGGLLDTANSLYGNLSNYLQSANTNQQNLINQIFGGTNANGTTTQGIWSGIQNMLNNAGTGLTPQDAQSMQNAINAANTNVQNLTGATMTNANQFSGLMGQGLSPAVQAAMNSAAIDLPNQQYQQGLQTLNSNLLDRGLGGGALPTSVQDLTSGMGSLIAARNAQTEQGLQNAAMQNQQQMNTNNQFALQGGVQAPLSLAQSLMGNYGQMLQSQLSPITQNINLQNQNNANALAALGQANSALSTLGSLYNPSQYINGLTGSINAGTGAVNAGTGSLGNANSLTSSLAQITPGSMSQLILSSLLSGIPAILGTSTGTHNGNSTTLLGTILGAIMGGGNTAAPNPGAPGFNLTGDPSSAGTIDWGSLLGLT